ncbi:hypothetical protein WMY93_028988 [Mugilogobius chulae]|uniref:Reverse transcriptase domain-containing protein n=1 Tax=Mugilogobius chulae TaxID=88201 RepID=A0AAW0MYZ4_9GOBI
MASTWLLSGLILLVALLKLIACLNHGNAAGSVTQRIQYTREFLLQYNVKSPVDNATLSKIQEHKLLPQRKRKRGKKGGVRQRVKRLKHRLPLPTCLLLNAQSLRAKTEELTANLRYLHQYRGACMLAITETWLDENIPSANVEPYGFTAFRLDRDPVVTGKSRGGGVCLLVRNEWCGSVVVRERLCTPHIELLCVSLRPYYLPRGLILWIMNFLCNRVQQVRIGSVLSDKIITNIGSPQGCVLSPLLYILYTNSCTSSYPHRHLVKFADDTALISLLHGDEQEHGPVLSEFISWCDDSHLLLNTAKTKEMIIDFRRDSTHCPTLIKGEVIHTVNEHNGAEVKVHHSLINTLHHVEGFLDVPGHSQKQLILSRRCCWLCPHLHHDGCNVKV